MTTNKKSTVTWQVSDTDSTEDSYNSETGRAESPTEQYVYSNTFEDSANEPVYTDTFVDDSYSNTFISETASRSAVKEPRGSLFSGSRSKRSGQTVSFEDSETSIQEATFLETAKNVTECLETVLEVDSDLSRTQDLDTMVSDTLQPNSYTDTFESSERTKVDSHYEDDFTEATESSQISYTASYASDSKSKTRKTFYSDDDDSLLDRSFIAPDFDGKSLTDDEDDTDVDDTYNDDYSYTFEATATETATASGLPKADMTAEEVKQFEQAKRQFIEKMVEKLRVAPKSYRELEILPSDPRDTEEKVDEYVKHYCRKKIRMLKQKQSSTTVVGDKVEPHPLAKRQTGTTLADYGVPESVMDRAKIDRILSGMKKFASEEIHDPKKCRECRDQRQQLDTEEAEKRFVKAQIMRLKNKVIDAKVEEHLLKMNSVSMIADIAKDLPRHSEKPEKILDRLFEPLLGKNVMR